MDKTYLIADDGSRKELTEQDVEALVAFGNTEQLQSVVIVDADGKEIRPFRFTDMDPPTFNDDGSVTI